MGSLDVASYAPIVAALVPMAIAWAGFATLPRVLDLISVGTDRPRRAASTSSGPNGWRSSARRSPPAPPCRWRDRSSFVGIIVPHLVRLIVGADHRLVLPASALFGGAFLIGCDLVARTIVRSARAARRHRHRHHRRAGIPMAAVPPRMKPLASHRPGRPCGLAASLGAAGAGAQRAERTPRRIVSLVPATTEMLFAMGAGDRVAGVSNYDRFPPEVERASARRRAARSGRRAAAVAEARPRHRLRHAGRSEAAARTRAAFRSSRTRTAACADITETMRALGERDRRRRRRERRGARASSSSSPPSARASRAGRGRRRCSSSGGSRARCASINASGGYGFLHDLLELAGGADVLGDLTQQSVADEHRDDPDAGARGDPRAALRRFARSPSGWTRSGGSGTRSPSVPAVQNNRVYLLGGDEFVVPGPRIVIAAERFARALHPGGLAITVNLVIWLSGHLVIIGRLGDLVIGD